MSTEASRKERWSLYDGRRRSQEQTAHNAKEKQKQWGFHAPLFDFVPKMLPLYRAFSGRSAVLHRFAVRGVRCFSSLQSLDSLSDSAILEEIEKKEVSVHKLESLLSDPVRALRIRRQFLFKENVDAKCSDIPSNGWDSAPFFSRVAVIIAPKSDL